MIEDKETKIKINSYINKHQRQKSYLRTCAPSEDSDQTAHRNLHWVHFRDSQGCKIFSCEQVRLIRLHERASLFESFLGVRQKAFFPILLIHIISASSENVSANMCFQRNTDQTVHQNPHRAFFG